MFDQIIYFIVVLVIFSVSYPGKSPGNSLLLTLVALGLSWAAFALYCSLRFKRMRRHYRERGTEEGRLTAGYHRVQVSLSIIAIILFASFTFLLNLRYWIERIPGFKSFTVLQGLLAVALFFLFLCTIWYFASSVYGEVFGIRIRRRSYILSNMRLSVPILFPWMILALIYDLVAMSPWGGEASFFNTMQGQILFFGIFLGLLMVILPVLVQSMWGCKPLERSEKVRQLEVFLHERGFKYRRLLRWPLFEGRMMTAGIMGLVSRYRYILITDSLFEILSIDELKAVLAHEMGHAKYRHLLFYLLFLMGYLVLAFGLFDFYFYFLASRPYFMRLLSRGHPDEGSLFYFVLSLPMVVSLIVYFRYVMGFFMRHFERQADLYSAREMRTAEYTISSLEKIALMSGKSRNVPSWHHFSIRERVDCLLHFTREPGFLKRQNRFLAICLSVFVLVLAALGYLLDFSPLKQHMTYAALESALEEKVAARPGDLALYENLAMLYDGMEEYGKAMRIYEKILKLDPDRPVALNNLAWLLLTSGDSTPRDKERALGLAKRAVSIERLPAYLDTLAEAYFENGHPREAIETIKEAIPMAKKNRDYYEKQLKKFASGGNRG